MDLLRLEYEAQMAHLSTADKLIHSLAVLGMFAALCRLERPVTSMPAVGRLLTELRPVRSAAGRDRAHRFTLRDGGRRLLHVAH